MKKKSFPVFILAAAFGLIGISCGGPAANEEQRVPRALEEPESAIEEAGEDTGIDRTSGREIELENEYLKEYVYRQLGKEEGSALYEEELEPYKGVLRKGDSSFVIQSGDDLDFVRTFFDLDTFWDFNIRFTPDGSGWTTQQLQGLADLQERIHIHSTGNTVPSEILMYLTGTKELIFDVTDITGEVAEYEFPGNIRSVTLCNYAPERYTKLLNYMQASKVESLSIYSDNDVDDSGFFGLDQIADMKNLLFLDLQDSYVRVEEPEKLYGLQLQALQCYIDDGVDLSFLKELPGLERFYGAVTETADLSPLFERKELALRIRFCQEMVEFEEDSYPEGRTVIFPELDEELKWKEEDEDEGNFLAIYQRFMDEEKKIECFSIRCIDEDERDMHHVRTFFRVTAGGRVQLLIPELDDPELAAFGDYRTDHVAITDINFDGANDIMLYTGGFGNQQANYAFAWIWEEESGQYVRSEDFRQIINPSVDTEQKLVRSSWRNSALSHSWRIYRYEDGAYKLQGELTESELYGNQIPEDMQVPDGAEVWEWVEEIYEEGQVVDTKSFTILQIPGEKTEYPDAYYRFYEPDSYWGNY